MSIDNDRVPALSDWDNEDREGEYKPKPSHGSGASKSHGSGGGKVDDAPNFNSTALDKNGKLFGILDVKDESLRSQINTFWPAVLTWGSEAAENLIGPAARKMAERAGQSEAQVIATEHHARNIAGYSVIFMKPGLEMASNIYQAGNTTANLARALKPLGKEGWECDTVQTVKQRTRALFTQNLMRTATGIVGSLPAWYNKVNKQALKREEFEKAREFKAATESGDPKKLAEYFKKHQTLNHGMDPLLERKALSAMLEEEETAYKANFKAFKESDEAKLIKDQIKKDFKLPETLGDSEDIPDIARLERYGVRDARSVQSELDRAPKGDTEKTDREGIYRVRTRSQVWSDFRKRFQKKELERIQNEAVRSTYVKREGAWDQTWEEALRFGEERSGYGGYGGGYGGGDKRIPTIKEQRQTAFNEQVKALHATDKDDKSKHGHGGKKEGEPNQIASMAAGVGAGIVGEMIGNLFGGKEAMEKYSQPTASDFIDALKKLQNEALKEGQNLPEEPELDESLATSLREAARKRGETAPKGALSYELIVHEIIQRNETDHRRPAVHKHEFQHLADAGWDAKKMKEIPEKDLTAYETAVMRWANLVETGQVAAIATHLIVGHKKYKITSVLKDSDEEAKKAVISRIDNVMKRYRMRDDVDEEKATQSRGGIVPSDEELRAAFGPGGLKGDQRAFTFALLEAVVQNKKKLCEITGMDETQCEKLGAECRDRFNKLLDSALIELAETIEKDPKGKHTHALKLTDTDKELIASLAKQVDEQDKSVADLAENREDLKTVQTAVVNAITSLGSLKKDKGGFWKGVMERFEKRKNQKPKAEAEASAEVDEDMAVDGDEEEVKPNFASKFKKHDKEAEREDEKEPMKKSADEDADKDMDREDGAGLESDDDEDAPAATGRWAKSTRASASASVTSSSSAITKRNSRPAKEGMDSPMP